MAATIDIEFEAGVFTTPTGRHQGYWAGDFSTTAVPGEWSAAWSPGLG